MIKKIICYVGVIGGVIFIILGIFLIGNSGNSKSYLYAESAEFGADYYTLQYEATKYVANNLAMLGEKIDDFTNDLYIGFGIGTIAFGLVVIAYFGYKLIEADAKVSIFKRIREDSLDSISAELPDL